MASLLLVTLEPPPIQRPKSMRHSPPAATQLEPPPEHSEHSEPDGSETSLAVSEPDADTHDDTSSIEPEATHDEPQRTASTAPTASLRATPPNEPTVVRPARHDSSATELDDSPSGQAPRPKLDGRSADRHRAIAAAPATAAAVGLGVLVGTQARRWTRQRACGEALEMATGQEALEDALECASTSVRNGSLLAVLGGAGIGLAIGGALGTGVLLGHADASGRAAPSDTRARIAAGATMVGIGGVTMLVGAPLLLRRQLDDPQEWSRWQGLRFVVTDVGAVIAAVGAGVLGHAVARRRRIRSQTQTRILPSFGRDHAGLVATFAW